MKVSVITVCFNADAVIKSCLDSVSRQSYLDVEHVIIDGGSTDQTLSIIRRATHVAHVTSEADGGIYDAMNKGIARSTGGLLLFLNADDTFASDYAIESAVREITKHPDADVYYGGIEIRKRDGTAVVYMPDIVDKAAEIMVCGCLPHQSTLAKRWVFERTGGFDTRYATHSDYDWFLKVIADPTIRLHRIEAVVGSFYEGGASSKLETAQPEVYHIQNSSPLYASRDWDQRRIAIYQGAFLAERIEASRLREELTKSQATLRAKRGRVTSPSIGNLFHAILQVWRRGFRAARNT